MKLNWLTLCAAALVGVVAGSFTAATQPSNTVTTAPVYVPDTGRGNEPLPDGVIVWDALSKTVDATNGQAFARFIFTFTNVATKIDVSLTNSVAVTNFTPVPVTILSVRPSCGCTKAELPPVPWTIPGGSNGVIKVSINLAAKSGTLFKSVAVNTDMGRESLMLRVNIRPAAGVNMTEEERAAGLAAAKVDRQAIFKGDCASCHLQNYKNKSGQSLYTAVCGICHDADNRATMVPDLAALKVPTNTEFWRTWVADGKPGSLMPAFDRAQGGPLNYSQITSLAVYLNSVHPSRVPPSPQ
jgi:mono/diheme cytochrome c family protein